MNRSLLTFIEKQARPAVMGATLVMFFIVLWLVNGPFVPGFAYLTQTFQYTPEQAYQHLTSIGAEGRAAHMRVLLADLLMVALYCLLFSTTTLYALRRLGLGGLNQNRFDWLALLPWGMGLVQILEVIGVFVLLAAYPAQINPFALVTNALTVVKFILTPVCFLIPPLLWIGLGIATLYHQWIQVRR